MQDLQNESLDSALGASYRLVEIVGQGASGQVWRALDRRTDETVAAKLLRAEHVADRDLVSRFVQERSVLVGLRHPNLVAVRDLVVEGERLAIVMDYLDGGSLRDVLRDSGPVAPALAVGLVAEVLDGLAAAHERRLVHRDIKPDNVLLTDGWRDLREGSVKLTDFGIARIVGEGEQTTTGLLGTPEYMSPELLTEGHADLPADVYGVGILLYELLAGRTPYAGPGTEYSVAHRHVTSQPPKLPVPDALWEAVEGLLAKGPRQRPTARNAAASLRRLVPELGELAALAPQPTPTDFATARGPVTVVRGLTPDADADVDEVAEEEVEPVRLEDLDLGEPGQATIVRAMPRTPVAAPRRHVEEAPQKPVWYRDQRILAGIAGTVVLVVIVAFVVLHGVSLPGASAKQGAASTVSASQTDEATKTGLSISRAASYDTKTETVELTITYAAQNSALSGPFLEVIPGLKSGCPPTNWKDAAQKRNLPTVTGIDTLCSWSVDPGTIDKQGKASVTAVVSLPLKGDPQNALQSWLDAAAAKTAKAVGDTEVTSTSYPVQRLLDIQVQAPQLTVTGKTLPLTLIPVWPKGPDKLNPLFQSPSVGRPSSLLTAIAGGVDGVRFSDACSGAVAVSSDGLTVTTLSVAPECAVNARVGNLTDLTSNTFSIVSRGG